MEGHVRKRGDKWYYSFEAASVNGQRKRIERVGGRTKKEAETALRTALQNYNNAGQHFDPVNISVADYLDYWLTEEVEKNKSHNTYLDYENKVEVHIKPKLGYYKLCALRTDAIQKWIDNIKNEGYAKSMVSNILACFSSALEYAVTPLQYIEENPCNSVKTPKVPINPKAKEHNDYICVKEDFDKIIEKFNADTNFYVPIMIGYHLGTRIAESYGFDLLTDINFETSKISINHQLQKEKGIWYLRPPKYDSYRTIKMGKIIREVLRKEITKRKENMLKYGQYYTKTYLMPDNSIVQFKANIKVPYKEIMPLSVKENGDLLTPESFKYCAKVIHYELSIPLFHSHCLRHTHGTILAENGAFPKTIMERLGHKNITTTLQTYVFNTDKMQQDAVDIFENVIANDKKIPLANGRQIIQN
jgi:integrase